MEGTGVGDDRRGGAYSEPSPEEAPRRVALRRARWGRAAQKKTARSASWERIEDDDGSSVAPCHLRLHSTSREDAGFLWGRRDL